MKRLITSLVLLFFSFTSFSQENLDSTYIVSLIEKAQLQQDSVKYEDSEKTYRKARELAGKLKDWDQYFTVSSRILESLWRQYKPDECIALARIYIEEINQTLGKNQLEEGKMFHQLATGFYFKTEYDSAILYFTRAVDIYGLHGGKGISESGAVYNNLGALYSQKGDLNKQEYYAKKALEVDRKVFGENHKYVATDLMNLGVTYQERSLFSEALKCNLQAYNIYKKLKGSDLNKLTLYKNLAINYISLQEPVKAQEYLEQALELSIKIYGKEHHEQGSILSYMATQLMDRGLFDLAENFADSALRVSGELKKTDPKMGIMVLRDAAMVKIKVNKSKKGFQLIDEAITCAKAISESNNHINYLTYYKARMFKQTEMYDSALFYFNKTVDLYKNEDYIENNALTQSHLYMAEIYKEKGDFNKAMGMINKSFSYCTWEESVTTDFYKIPLSKINDKFNFLNAISFKVELMKEIYENSPEEKIASDLLKSLSKVQELININRRNISAPQDKRIYQNLASDFYQIAIDIVLAIAENENDADLIERCFYHSEAGKAGILRDVLINSDELEMSLAGDSLFLMEQDMYVKINYYQTLLNQELKSTDSLKNIDRISLYKQRIFDHTKTIDSISFLVKNQFPDFYQIRYSQDEIEVKDIQKKLNNKEAVIEYQLGDKKSYIFLITKNTFKVMLIPERSVIERMSLQYNRSINLQKENEIPIDSLKKSGFELYKTLFLPMEAHLSELGINKLLIIPDGGLGYLSFETLNKSQKTPVYLIENYNISYSYSATLYFSEKDKRDDYNDLLSFAPSYKIFKDSLENESFTPLFWNQSEAKDISVLLAGRALLGSNATERAFKEKGKEAGILHLAMHTLLDDKAPMNSKLVFYQNNDSIEDGFLHSFELYNLKLNAKMAVLSGCETGYGNIVQGEGIVSLARGFAYAGVPSVVMSHWQVDDESSSILMNSFYEYLYDGNSKSESLRKAKLEYLKNADIDKKHPFYWGALVLVGDDSPIKSSYDLMYLLVVAGLLVFLLLLALFKYTKNKKYL